MQNQQPEFGKVAENSKPSLKAPVIADYMDYRLYLADFYRFRKLQTKNSLRPYNYQMFSAAADIKSPNYLKMIIEGKRNLSVEMVGKFGKAIGLDKRGTEELLLLVNFTQATDPAERNVWLKKLSEHRVGDQLKTGEIDKKTWQKVPNWIAWVIYAMADQDAVKFDIATLKKLLRNKASEDEIESALSILLQSGELVQDEATGQLKKARTLMEAAEDVPVALVRKLQAQLMYLGLESLYQDGPTEREFGTLTMSMTRAEFEDVKFRLRQLRKGINKDNSLARSKTKGEKVYQLNIQLFPITDSAVSAVAPMASAEIRKDQVMAEFIDKARALQQTGAAPVVSVQTSAAPDSAAKTSKSVVGSLLEAASTAASLFDDSSK